MKINQNKIDEIEFKMKGMAGSNILMRSGCLLRKQRWVCDY